MHAYLILSRVLQRSIDGYTCTFACAQEVETLLLYKSIVEEGPDLFSLHRVDIEAPFRYVKDTC